MTESSAAQSYWNRLAKRYQQDTKIALDDFHYGPLVPGDRHLKLLPPDVAGLTCLELGCGAAQNSILLASRGAKCTAVDIAPDQLRHGRQLAGNQGLDVAFLCADMDALPPLGDQGFDLVHSSYALSFSTAPRAWIQNAARLLKPGGQLLLSTGHPLAAFEWLELEDETCGAFVADYFTLPEDARTDRAGAAIASRVYPVSTLANWIVEAGLDLQRILEPMPLPLSPEHPPPYTSPDWEALRPQFERIPVVVIYSATA